MEEDIKILEEYINCGFNENEEIRAIKNLLTRYKQLEEENRGLKIFKEMTIYRLDVIEPRELISKSKIEEQIKWLDNDIKNTKNKLEEGKRPYPNYIGEHRRLRMKAFITKSKEIKQRLQDLLREE